MCVYICMYIYKQRCTHISICNYIQYYTCTILTYTVYICMCIYTHDYICIYIYICICRESIIIYTHKYIYIYISNIGHFQTNLSDLSGISWFPISSPPCCTLHHGTVVVCCSDNRCPEGHSTRSSNSPVCGSAHGSGPGRNRLVSYWLRFMHTDWSWWIFIDIYYMNVSEYFWIFYDCLWYSWMIFMSIYFWVYLCWMYHDVPIVEYRLMGL